MLKTQLEMKQKRLKELTHHNQTVIRSSTKTYEKALRREAMNSINNTIVSENRFKRDKYNSLRTKSNDRHQYVDTLNDTGLSRQVKHELMASFGKLETVSPDKENIE